MSTTYNIDFSEPVKVGFQIRAGAYNGPGGNEANTNLRLFGRGAREWGEAIDENLVRLTENFASASAPSVAIGGQMWVETQIYYHDTSGTPYSGWYRFDLTTRTWELIGGTGVVDSTPSSNPTVGHYYYADGVDTLFGFYSLGKYEPAAYLTRSHAVGNTAPGGLIPAQKLFVFDANDGPSGKWKPQTSTEVTDGDYPQSPTDGLLWFNRDTGHLSVWTGSVWHNVLGPTIGGYTTSSGPINMAGNKIINLGWPDNSDDATTKFYVDNTITTALANGIAGYLPLTGGTVTGPLTVNGGLGVAGMSTLYGGASLGHTLHLNGNVIVSLGSPYADDQATNKWYVDTNFLRLIGGTMSGAINMNNNKISNLGTPTASADATPKWYVDTNFLPLIGGTMSGAINMNNNKISNLGTPTASADATPKWYVDSAVPPGMVSAFGGQAPPTGWLKANGAAISRTTYANLFASIGTTHGAGDGSTTFNLPDLRGEHIRAFDDGRGVDGGRLIGSFQGSQNLTHNHGINDPGHNHYINDPGHSHGVYDPGHSHPLSDPGHTHNSRYGLDTPSGLDRNPGLGQEIGTWGDERHVPTTWSGTGVSISASVSQIGIYGAAAGIWNSPAGAGISTVASGGAEVRVRNIALLFCIKY